MTLKANCQIGLDFREFLKETNRTGIKDRDQLKKIYNTEFRYRPRKDGIKGPNFANVIYALKLAKKVQINGRQLNFKATGKLLYQDQWPSPRDKPSAVQNQRPGQKAAKDSIPPNGAQTGAQAQRQLAKLLMNKLKTDRAMLISDKRGVSITSDHKLEDGKISMCVEGVQEYVVKLYVENTGAQPVYFTYYSALHWLKYFTLKDEHKVTPSNPFLLAPGAFYEIQVILSSVLVGFYPATLAFAFKPDLKPSSASFHIVRYIEAKCMTSLGVELAPKAPYKRRTIAAPKAQEPYHILDGVPPESQSLVDFKIVNKLEAYDVPTSMGPLVLALRYPSSDKNKKSDRRKDVLEGPLNSSCYTEKFQLLLYMEEQQMQADIKRYNIPSTGGECAPMFRDQRNKKLLVLEVPGVSENRPSVLRGDQLIVWQEEENDVKYRGFVHSVALEKVHLSFHPQLLQRFIDGMKFHVEFTVNRLTMRLQHRAAVLMSKYKLGDVLFPTQRPSSQQIQLPSLSLFDRQLEQNPEQYKAVQHIVAGSSKPAPYLVFGPPGTGKTVTVVEAIKQIEKTQASCHILACAPSNSAADLLCEKIVVHVDARKVYRMYASSVNPNCVPDALKKCCNLKGDTYTYPARETLMTYKIMVTTLFTAGRLVTGGIPPGHFTHVFVDEAGHAVETEGLIPLAGLLQPDSGQVVLAGDPKQLGPIVRSPLALKYGLSLSMLQRLMENSPLYKKQEGTYNNHFVTKLLKNYRSHPAILEVPNRLFYDGELQVCANEIIRNSYCRWEYLPKMGFPVIFHGVVGLDEREESSPSFFNVAEVEVLMYYVKKLLETEGKKGLATISPKEIGIIAPYRKQVQKIRTALEKVKKNFKRKDLNMSELKVGSVEEFQGQERKVILVSTVRSSSKYAEIDQKFTLGFVKNDKRFNVAMTRAKALLIVVGNPRVLRTDPTWDRFIQYCRDGGGYTGFTHTEDDDEVVARLAALFIQIEAQVETEESEVQQQLDPEWRNEL